MVLKNELEKLPGLDVIRGLAILWVLLYHSFILGGKVWPLSFGDWLSRCFLEFVNFGWLGVDLFFVLSGFLITRILLSTRGSKTYFSSFYVRRALRIFPLYYGFLIVVFFVFCLPAYHLAHWPAAEELLSDQAWYWTYLANIKVFFTNRWQNPYINHTWSLAVEEQFYLFWPLFCWLLAPRKLAWLCLGIILACPAVRVFLAWRGASDVVLKSFTFAQIDLLAFGALLSLRASGWITLRRLQVFWGAGLAFSLLALCAGRQLASGMDQLFYIFTITGIAFSLLILAGLEASNFLAKRDSSWLVLLASFGKYSYAIYLIHQPMAVFGLQSFSQRFITPYVSNLPLQVAANFVCLSFVAYTVSWAIYHGYEKHFLGLKKYWAYSSLNERKRSAP